MSKVLFSTTSRAIATAMLLFVGLCVVGSARHVAAEEIADSADDFLPEYTGPHDAGLDVLAHEVLLVGDRVIFFGRMAGPIAPTKEIGGLYLFGLDRGRGTPRFTNGTPVIGPNVTWDLIVRINPDGTGLVNNQVASVVTPLDRADIRITDDEFIASVPLALLLPASTLPPEKWTYNLWPRNGIVPGRNENVSDLAPDDGNSPVQTVPEVECSTDLATLAPPNHQMVEVDVFIRATDAWTHPADLALQEVIVASDEPDDAKEGGDGNTTGDTDGQDGFTAPVEVTQRFTFNADTGFFEGSILLRAERAGSRSGRTYTIEATVLNSYNNSATSRCVVVVPNDELP